MIDTILSDLGKVLLDFDNGVFFRRLAERTGTPVGRIRQAALEHTDLAVLFDRGALSPADFWKNAGELLGVHVAYEDFFADYADIFAPRPGVLDLFRRLRPKYRMGLLSNTDVIRWSFIKRRFPEILMFDAYALSFDLGHIKPDAAVFRLALELLEAEPARVVFIDDLEANVEAALRLGLAGIVCRPQTDLEAELGRMGVRP